LFIAPYVARVLRWKAAGVDLSEKQNVLMSRFRLIIPTDAAVRIAYFEYQMFSRNNPFLDVGVVAFAMYADSIQRENPVPNAVDVPTY